MVLVFNFYIRYYIFVDVASPLTSACVPNRRAQVYRRFKQHRFTHPLRSATTAQAFLRIEQAHAHTV